MNFIDGKLYRLMQRAKIPDDLILKMDDILRNNPDCRLKVVQESVKNFLKIQKHVSNLTSHYDYLLKMCLFKRGDLLKILTQQQKEHHNF